MGKGKHNIQLIIKYTLDRVFALLCLLIISPIFGIISLILKCMRQDVFYKQIRVGEGGKDFIVYKFTTMPKGSENFGLITTINDSRPFLFGRFLRRTKMNELPQLINILSGSMSFVGPRPLIRRQIEDGLTEENIKNYYTMRPGITGAGSLYFHHEDRLLAQIPDPHQYYRTVILPQKKLIEQTYANSWNLWLDVKILFLTIGVVIFEWMGKDVSVIKFGFLEKSDN